MIAGSGPARSSMRRVPGQEQELEWLLDRPGMDPWTGLDPDGWEASIWVLHAMYENPRSKEAGTHDDIRLARLAAGEPEMIGAVSLDEVTTDTGIPLGYVSRPKPGWSRLTWADYLTREGCSLEEPHKTPPSFSWFRPGSFPVSIQPPPEGSMDLETFEALITVIGSLGVEGSNSDCFAFVAGLPAGMDAQDPYHLWKGTLGALPTLLEREDCHYKFTPTNWWPSDRSWFVLTDYDLQATKVSGSRRLIQRIRNDTFLETTDWTAPDLQTPNPSVR